MSNNLTEHFLRVLAILAPDLDATKYPSMVEAISRRISSETDSQKAGGLAILLSLETAKPLSLYRCISNEFVDVATEQQALLSALEYRKNGVITINKRQYYVV